MKNQSEKGKQISRRNILPILGSSLLIPFLGFSKSTSNKVSFSDDETDDELQTLLKPDGSTVKVKVSTLKKSTVIQKKLSNKSLLNWLSEKF